MSKKIPLLTPACIQKYIVHLREQELTVKPRKAQKALFADESKELTRKEYTRLVRAAECKENERLS